MLNKYMGQKEEIRWVTIDKDPCTLKAGSLQSEHWTLSRQAEMMLDFCGKLYCTTNHKQMNN